MDEKMRKVGPDGLEPSTQRKLLNLQKELPSTKRELSD
jgi:hypothetical protein